VIVHLTILAVSFCVGIRCGVGITRAATPRQALKWIAVLAACIAIPFAVAAVR
jgi:hypothetical protein